MRRFVSTPRSSKALVALGATLVGVVASLTATIAPAAAAGPTASLAMNFSSADFTRGCWTASGHIPMSNYNAEGYLDNGATLHLSMYGDDPVVDDHLHYYITRENTAGGIYFYGSSRGIEWYWSGCAPRTTLDEDWGEDEIYVAMAVVDGDGRQLAYRNTNVVRTSW
jgi:hypothetical protein